MIRVSIIIPAYNASHSIERCLLSAIRQSYPALEYVVVDDCSKDDTKEKVEQTFCASDRLNALVLITHERNEGVAEARNSGLRNATGDYIYFLDSDDELPLDAIESLVSLVEESSMADLVIGELEVVGASRSRFGRVSLPDGKIEGNESILSAFLEMSWPDMTCNKLERRAFLLQNRMRFQSGIVHEDALWGFELAMNACSMIVSHKVTYIYHVQDVSITQRKNDKNFSSLLVVLSRIVSHIADRNLQESQSGIWDYLSDFRIYYYKELIRAHMPADYIKEKIWAIREIINGMPVYPYKKRFASRLKDLAYILPIRLGMFYVKMLVVLSK
ncbi:glycosyltransferase family 2 protein [Parabacteroides sp.]